MDSALFTFAAPTFALALTFCLVCVAWSSPYGRRESALTGAIVGAIVGALIGLAVHASNQESDEWESAIASLGDQYGVSITRHPTNTSTPGEWKISGQFLDCYAEGLPDPKATEAERDADPLLMCAATDESFVPYDELGNGSDYAEADQK